MISEGIGAAFRLIASGDPEVFSAMGVSLKVALCSSVIAGLAGVPFGTLLAVKSFRGQGMVVTVLNTLMAVPTVLIGLIVYGVLSRRGPLGFLELLYTPAAMVVAEVLLGLPIVTALSYAAVRSAGLDVFKAAETLGAGTLTGLLVALRESSYGVLSALLAAFGRIVGEVGAALIVGGNIKGSTRTLTTAITLRTGQGDFDVAVALGIVLLLIALAVNTLFLAFHWRVNR